MSISIGSRYSILVLSALLATPAMLPLSAKADHNHKREHDPFPHIRLSKKEYRGKDAASALEPHMDEISKHYKMAPGHLKRLFESDRSLRTNHRGLLYYVEEAALTDNTLPFNPSPDMIPASDTFALHSQPDASGGTVYLSFKGTTVSDTPWNSDGPIVAEPYSQDSDPRFSEDELREIRAIWLSVAEDYAPFNVDVTTEKPLNPDPVKNIEIVITPSSSWYGQPTGGICYLGSFTWDSSQKVCWVFSNMLGNNSKYIAEASSHESGHSFGLQHWAQFDTSNGAMISPYYWGNANWAPIMGGSYYAAVSTWSKGEYTGAGTTQLGVVQDDIAVIASITGTVADEASRSPASAKRLNGSIDSNGILKVQQRGILSSASDSDVYLVDTIGGDLHFTISPSMVSPNADFRIQLTDSSGTVLMNSDPSGVGAATIDAYGMARGTYYLIVNPVGTGNAKSDGYSSYGSIGEYYVTGSYALATPPSAKILTPTSGKTVQVNSTFTVTATATDNKELSKLVIFVNGKVLCRHMLSVASAIVSCTIKAPSSPTTLTIRAKATDDQGTLTTSTAVKVNVVR
jgi:hypothetical protein